MSTIAPVWLTARAAGLAALVMATLAVTAGTLLGGRFLTGRGRAGMLRATHEALAIGTLALVVVHGLALLADPVLRPGLAGVIVPFAAPYRPLATALGQVAAYGMAGLGLTFYVRRRLGAARWRRAHRFVPVFWALGVLHGILTGTDASRPWALALILPPVLAATAVLATRHYEAAPAAR